METQNSTSRCSFDLVRSVDPDELSEFVTTVVSKEQYAPRQGDRAFNPSTKIARIGEFNVWRTSNGSGFELQAQNPQNSRFEIHFVETGHHILMSDNQNVRAQQGQAYLLQQFDEHNIHCQPKTGLTCISIPEARYAKLMATEFEDAGTPLAAFRPVVDINCPEIRNLKQLADLLMSLGCCEKTSWQSSVGAHLLTEAFLALFIEAWPREGTNRSTHVAKPFYVKRAVDWVHEHLAEKILLEDLASASGVSVRTLQLGFRKFVGLSPMGYVLKVRLQHAHNDLLKEPAVTIDEVAARWGFPSPSKFAAQIRTEYGHNPSDLRRLFQIRRHRQD